MAEVLSQTEIDALLSAVSSGMVETEEPPKGSPPDEAIKKGSGDWVAYDLTTHEKMLKGKLSGFQGIHERFCRLFRITLSQILRKTVTVNYSHSDFIKFSEYLGTILVPASINIIRMKNLTGYMMFVFNSKLAYALVDAYYGGSERPFSKIGGREEFTSIETNMINKICTLAVQDLQQAWKLNYPLELEQVRSESNPHFVGSIHGSESVAVVTFDIEFENLSGTLIMVLQLKALDPIQHLVSVNVTGEIPPDSSQWRRHWTGELMTIALDVTVELGRLDRSLLQVTRFKKGDILPLHQDATSPLAVLVQGMPKFQGLVGLYRGNQAVRIVENPAPPANKE